MSTDHALPPTPTATPSSAYAGPATPAVLTVAVAAGVVLGVVDLWWSTYHPSAWSSVANSCAGWAACAFVLGAALRVDALRAAVAAVVMLAVAVEAYYAAEVVLQFSDRTVLTSPVAMEWLVLAGVAGAVFGPAGAWASGRSPVLAAAGLAVGVALLLGDAWQLAHGSYGAVGGEPRVLVLLALAMLAASLRRPVVTIAAFVLSLPLSLVVAAAFTAGGVYM
ncbi:hypothetical protein GCM10023350_38470 [Nocardioides endophyticus]|uniref:Uncharacterized protein n=1 Tax=Nocardioides endophyticus TaxID=1353775 RepID=A0ABP8Z8N5_9ACTN